MDGTTFPTPSLDHWTTLFLLAAAQGFFLAFMLVWPKKGYNRGNKLLGLLVFFFALSLLEYVLHWSNYIWEYIHMMYLYIPISFLYGPLLYLYYRYSKPIAFDWRDLLHFAPAILWVINWLPLYLATGDTKRALQMGDAEAARQVAALIYGVFYLYKWLLVAHLVTYAFLIYRFKKKHFPINETKKQEDNTRARWYQTAFYLYLAFVVAYISYFLLLLTPYFNLIWDYGICFSMMLFIYAIGYRGYRQPEILLAEQPIGPKYENSSLTLTAAQSLHTKLLEYMEQQRPFLDNELRLDQLAEGMGVSRHHLSQVINEQCGKSFSDFITGYRIREAQRLLLDPQHQSTYIINIAYAAGFNNKTSFNKAFKMITGTSPSDYKRMHMAK